ncbi:MAG TPA: hypothetical protein VGO67_05095 [Verrucomicrobiae bacterium]|jgi:hypothetical protein
MTRLFTTLFPEANTARLAEYTECLSRNLDCAEIAEIYLMVEGERVTLPNSPKLHERQINRRPNYSDYFSWISGIAKPEDISIIANRDIYFDGQLGLFKFWELPQKTVLALSRWDIAPDGTAALFDRNDSQDVWIFRGPLQSVNGDFPIGVPRCDNRILFEFQEAGYCVLNPAFSVRSYHLHAGTRIEYAGTALSHFIAPPYRYMWPHNLWSLPRTLLHNIFHPRCRVGWTLDQRRLARTVPVRGLNKIGRTLRRPA